MNNRILALAFICIFSEVIVGGGRKRKSHTNSRSRERRLNSARRLVHGAGGLGQTSFYDPNTGRFRFGNRLTTTVSGSLYEKNWKKDRNNTSRPEETCCKNRYAFLAVGLLAAYVVSEAVINYYVAERGL